MALLVFSSISLQFSLGAADVPDLFVKNQQVNDTRLHDLIRKKFPSDLIVEKQRQIVHLLAEEMCDPNGRIAEGITPLHLAVEVHKYHIACIFMDFMDLFVKI